MRFFFFVIRTVEGGGHGHHSHHGHHATNAGVVAVAPGAEGTSTANDQICFVFASISGPAPSDTS